MYNALCTCTWIHVYIVHNTCNMYEYHTGYMYIIHVPVWYSYILHVLCTMYSALVYSVPCSSVQCTVHVYNIPWTILVHITCIVYNVPCTSVQCNAHYVLSTIELTCNCKIYIVQCTTYIIQCLITNLRCTLYTLYCILALHNVNTATVQCTLYNVQCTLYIVHYI